MKALLATLPLALALVAAACGGDGPVADEANDTAGIDAAVADANQAAEAAHQDSGSTYGSGEGFEATSSKDGDTSAGIPIMEDDAAAAVIPAQYRGRWGMVAADCTSTRGDAKGLIVIGDRIVRFYESTATLKEQRPAIAEAFSGLFDFSGEGERWTKVMTFVRTGDRLKRSQDDGSFTYRKC